MSRKKKNNHSSYKHAGGFVGLPCRVFKSKEYGELSLKARCLLDELQYICRGDRNGRLVLSVENAAENMSLSYNTAKNAFDELQEAEFIEQMLEHRYTKKQAREWRLTFQPCYGKEPTDCWRRY